MSETKPFLPVAGPDLSPLEEEYLLDAFRSGWISSLGPYIERFEREFAEFCEASYAVAVSNGTVALHLALLAAGVGPGDEVIVPALTFVATAAAVVHAGATPVFVDSEPEIGTMDPVCVEKALSPKTKAVIPVHLYGHPADMDPIMEIARRRELVVIEDAAEAHGARYKGKRVGGIGHMATFSFYGNKIITTGEGGMVVTNDEKYQERVRFLKDHAMDKTRRYWHPEVGYNYRMTNLQAAIGCAQLARSQELLASRFRLLHLYKSAFTESSLSFNPSRAWAEPVVWLVCGLLSPASKHRRNTMSDALRANGIDSRPGFPLVSTMPPYEFFRRSSSLDVARGISERAFNLPSSARLGEKDVDRIATTLKAILSSQSGGAE